MKSWKGAKENTVIYLNILVLDCGLKIDLVKGNEFLLYVPPLKKEPLFENNNPTVWFICGRSDSVEKAEEDIVNMDKIQAESRSQ